MSKETKEVEKSEEALLKEEIEKSIQKLDLKEKIQVVALNYYLDKKKQLDKELENEMKALQIKYEKLSQPLYEEQGKIIQGLKKPSEEELKDIENFLKDEEKQQYKESVAQEPVKDYWFKVLTSCDLTTQEIKEKDEPLLKHLIDIKYLQQDGSSNFDIIFVFSKNDYFTNDNLKLSFFFDKDNDDEPVKMEGPVIDWKEGKNVTVKIIKKTQKNKKSGAKRVITKEVEDESFFNIFKSVSIEGADKKDEEDEEQMKIEDRLNLNFDIIKGIIDEVLPYSLEYFLGIKKYDEDDDDDHEDDGIDSCDDKDDDQDDKDDQDSEDDQKKDKKKKKQHKKSTDSNKGTSDKPEKGGDKEKPECKQQ